MIPETPGGDFPAAGLSVLLFLCLLTQFATMSIEQAEKLKREWTDKYVVVNPDVPYLRRFQNLTGTVKTVNMNCRALVEFDGPEDIGWYDIDLNNLQVVDAPVKKKKAPAEEAEAKPATAKKSPAKTAGKSPLELARQQAGGGGAKAESKPAGKKLSPLELARQQAAGGGAKAESKPAGKAESKPAGKKLSPLELARQQGAGGGEKAPAEETVPPAESAAPQNAPAKDAGKNLSPLERARLQDQKKNG